MTDPISRARDEAEALPPGPYQYRPNRNDDWGFVRDANGDIMANTCPSRLVHKFHDEFDYATKGYGEEWLAGPPQARAVAQLLIDAEANQRKVNELAAENERLRSERSAYRRLAANLLKQARGLREWEALPCADQEAQALQEPTR